MKKKKDVAEILESFRADMSEKGYAPPDPIRYDEKYKNGKPFFEFPVTGDKGKDYTGWYALSLNGGLSPYGAYGDFRTRQKFTWTLKSATEISDEEKLLIRKHQEEAQRKAEEEYKRIYESGVKKASWRWDTSVHAESHWYLKEKDVPAFGLKTDIFGTLLIPMYANENLTIIQSLQEIKSDRSKKYLSGAKSGGAFHLIKGDDTVFIFATGYATSATCYVATGYTTIITFDDSNISKVIKYFRNIYPDKRFIIAGDDDIHKDDNGGRKSATQAARKYKCEVVFPKFKNLPDDKTLLKSYTDFNDLQKVEGIDAVRTQLSESSKALVGSSVILNPYVIENNGFVYKGISKTGEPTTEDISDFTAEILSEITLDNGVDRKIEFEIIGINSAGNLLKKVRVSADKFPVMNWIITEWGGGVIISAGNGKKDHLRAAIQHFSKNRTLKDIYTHLGWRKVKNEWLYFTHKSIIGKDGLSSGATVEMASEEFKRYSLPAPVGNIKEAIKDSLQILNLTDRKDTVPLLASIYRAPLNEFAPIAHSIFILGEHGTKKSEIAALMLAHFGQEFHAQNFPENWNSSENALELSAFLAKDAPLVIDDFVPKGTKSKVDRLHEKAERILRTAANHSSRGRLNPDATLKKKYPPRCMVIVTGEELPIGESLQGRFLTIEISNRTAVLTDKLTLCQQAARKGSYALAMAGYIKWLAGQDLNKFPSDIKDRQLLLRDKCLRAYGKDEHLPRTPDIISSLQIGLEYFLQYALASGAITKRESEEYAVMFWEHLLDSGRKQMQTQRNEDPVNQFMAMLSSALASGKAHIADDENDKPKMHSEILGWRKDTAQGDRIGWMDSKTYDFYLIPDAVFACVHKLAAAQNVNISVQKNTMLKRMREKGLLKSHAPDRCTATVRICNKVERVIHLASSVFIENDQIV